ncbi:hypothetical protein [Amycolatopsis sp. NPDC051061]|uniref:NACHT and WD40 repeat domain-containing protein n=1 Tax=Amycolatopsis sp. NPDC051061 TaxID=3155042 RepID=UPI00341EEE1F
MSGDRRRARVVALSYVGTVLLIVATLTIIVGGSTTLWGDPQANMTVIAGAAAVLSLAAGPFNWLQRRRHPAAPRVSSDLVDELADIVDLELRGEAANRGLRGRGGPIPFAWDGGGTHSEHDFEETTRLLAERFRALPTQRLLILGEPGSGKTALLLMLAIGLSAGRVSGRPTPVMLALSDWDLVALESLDEFVVRAVAQRYYGGSTVEPARLLGQGLIVPLLDGLDELAESDRTVVVKCLNEAIDRSDQRLVVVCRQEDYDQIIAHGSRHLRDTTRVTIKPLDVTAIVRGLTGSASVAGTKWEGLLAAPGSAVVEALSTPLMVSLAKSVYEKEGTEPKELIGAQFRSRQDIEDHITREAVRRAYQDDNAGQSDSSQGIHQLASVARAIGHSNRDIAWWRLHERLLAPWPVLAVSIASGLVYFGVCLVLAQISVRPEVPGLAVIFNTYGAALGGLFAATVLVVWLIKPHPEPVQLVVKIDGSWARLRRGFWAGIRTGTAVSVPLLLAQAVFKSVYGNWNPNAVIDFVQWSLVCLLLPIVLGVALAAKSWLSARSGRATPAGPQVSRRRDRNASIAGAAATAIVVAVLVVPAWTLAMVVGTLLGNVVTNWPGYPGTSATGFVVKRTWEALSRDLSDPAVMIAALVLPALFVGLLVLLTYAWPRSILVVFAPRRNTPRRLMRFLADAHKRQVLRRFGNVYQFRHVRVQELLTSPEGVVEHRIEARKRRIPRPVYMIGVVVLLSAMIAVPFLVGPWDEGVALTAGDVVDVRWAPSGKTLVTASRSGSQSFSIARWSAATGQLVGHRVRAVAWAMDPVTSVIATASSTASGQAPTVDLWGENGEHLFAVSEAADLEFSPQGKTFAVFNDKTRAVQLWNENTGALGIPPLQNVVAGTFSPYGTAFVTVDAETLKLRLTDTVTGKNVDRLAEVPPSYSQYYPHGRSLAAPKPTYQQQASPFIRDTSKPPVATVVFPGEGTMSSYFAVGVTGLAALEVRDSEASPYRAEQVPTDLLLWDLTAGPEQDYELDRVEEWQFDQHGTLSVRYDLHIDDDPNGVAGNAYSYLVRRAGERNPMSFKGFSEDLAATGDSVFVLGASQGGRRILNGKTGEQVGQDFQADSLILPTSGCCFAAKVDDEHVRVGQIGTGAMEATIRPPQPVIQFPEGRVGGFGDFEFSPDGSALATSQIARGVDLWSVPDGHLSRQIDGAEGWQFSDRGDLLAVANSSFSIEVLSVSTGQTRTKLTGHTSSIRSMWFSLDGTELATASDDLTVRVWHIPS